MGSKEGLYAETKLLCLFAKLIFSAPHRQVLRPAGRTVLCIPLVHGSYPAAMNCWAFLHTNNVWWFAFLKGHVREVCPSLMSNPHEKQMLQLLNRL